MRHLLTATLTVILAASYLTLGVLSPRAATALGVWLTYALLGTLLGILELRSYAHGKR